MEIAYLCSMRSFFIGLITTFCFTTMHAQDSPGMAYADISELPDTLTSGTVIARFIDGLGFRYFWATDSLRKEDLAYRISKDARSTQETIDHIYELSEMIYTVAQGEVNRRPRDPVDLTFEGMRQQTLFNLHAASTRFAEMAAAEFEELAIKFSVNDQASEAPLWLLYNGPIADALFHTGQVVAYRRASGNPIARGVNVFRGVKN